MPKRERPSDKKKENTTAKSKTISTKGLTVNKKKDDASVSTTTTAKNKKKGFTDLDDIFAVKKKIKTDAAEEEKQSKAAKSAAAAASSKSKTSFSYSRKDVEALGQNAWQDDGLGGKYNREGYTGRTEGGVKVFKAHLFNQKNFGDSKDCPFDCDCCFI
jgi:hypothetical protein